MKRTIQILISISLLLILFFWIDFDQIKNSLIEAEYLYLSSALIIITLDRFLMGWKWKLLLRVKNIKISVFHATKIYYISNFLGLFLPPTVGTDLVRAYCLSKKESKTHDIFASMVMERLIGFWGIFVAGLFGCFYFFNFVSVDSIDIFTISIIVGVLALATTVGFFISMSRRSIKIDKESSLYI